MFTSQNDSPEGKTIRELPNEILLTIFSYLQTHDVKYNVSNVCVQWSNLAKDKKLWRHLYFKTTNKTTKTFGSKSWYSTLKFLENTPELQNVIVSQGHSEEEIAEILKSLNDYSHDLRHLEFEEEIGSLARHFKGFDNLFRKVESLNLTLGTSQAGVFKILARFLNLKRILFLGANPNPTEFQNFFRKCPFVESINVSGVNFSKTNFMTLWKFKDTFTNLSLKIDDLDENCLKLLGLFPKLETVVLADGNASPKKLFRIGNLKCLTSLHLQEAATSPVLTATALAEFFRDGWFLKLRELKLHNSRLNDGGAAEIRRKCLNLVYLEVMTYPRSLSNLTEKALLHFLHCNRLQHLEILFDNSVETDWIYRRIRHIRHDCDIDEACPLGLEQLLTSWDEILIPVD